ncbi:hypothetical protein ONZ45_g12731 [Pleurotus djamor]|nr:hypothetical protein ONZ45_g12731 [Pleurotus djamor]
MPSLQTLRLSGVRCLRNFPALPNLQELLISQCSVSLEDTPVEEIVAVLLHVLKSTPKLKSLDLDALPTPLASNPSSAKHTFSTVTLSLLEAIHISCCHSSYELLLGHLDLPVVTHADLDLSHYEGDPPASLSHLCHLISRTPSFTNPAVPIHVSMEFPRNLKVTSPDKPAFLSINVPKPTQTSWQDYIRLFTLHAPATTYVSLTAAKA